jgi:hypothetical protein
MLVFYYIRRLDVLEADLRRGLVLMDPHLLVCGYDFWYVEPGFFTCRVWPTFVLERKQSELSVCVWCDLACYRLSIAA